MAFKDTYRLEKVYYENIWTLLKLLKNVDKNNVDMGTVKELLDNAIADNESIIIIYKNLGELYAELQNQHMELGKELEKLKDSLEEFKDEINDKIDENHNYLMGLIKDLEQRVDALEQAVDSLEERMDQAETDIDNLETRMDTAEGDIDNLETAVDGLEDNLTALEGRVTTNEGDIDDLEQNKQDKLTAGSGIAIDPDTNEISNTAQGKIYTAGSGIAIDPVTNEITNTAQGATYTSGKNIEINNNEITAKIPCFVLASNPHNFSRDMVGSGRYGVIDKLLTGMTLQQQILSSNPNLSKVHGYALSVSNNNIDSFKNYMTQHVISGLTEFMLNARVYRTLSYLNNVVDTVVGETVVIYKNGNYISLPQYETAKLFNLDSFARNDSIELTIDTKVCYNFYSDLDYTNTTIMDDLIRAIALLYNYVVIRNNLV